MKLSAPRSLQQTFSLFMRHFPGARMEDMFYGIDWEGVTSQQIYQSCFGRLPEHARNCAPLSAVEAYEKFFNSIHSLEFQARVISLLLTAFPDKRRRFFIHVPKCAGADLTSIMASSEAVVQAGLADAAWTSQDAFFDTLSDIVNQIMRTDSIVVAGHIPLRSIVESGQIRFTDEVFTTVRDPIDRIISEVNYAIDIMKEQVDRTRPDRLLWLAALGRDSIDHIVDQADIVSLATEILEAQGIIRPNTICEFLGSGDFASAVDLLVRTDIEITDTGRYDVWLAKRWPRKSTKLNASTQWIKRCDLSADTLSRMETKCAEDLRLYRAIHDLLNRSSDSSIRGGELYSLASEL